MATFTLTAGTDVFSGVPNENNTFFFTPPTLQSTDAITGTAGASFVDSLGFTGSGTVTANQFAGVTNIELLELSAGGNSVSLTNGLVGGTGTGVFAVFDRGGNDTVDASGVTNGTRIAFYSTGGIDTFIGGNGNDYFEFLTFAALTAADSVNGGAGFDILLLSSTTFPTSAFTNVTGIEVLRLITATVALTNGLVGSSGPFVVHADGVQSNSVDASGVTNGTRVVFFASGHSHDTLIGGDGDDYFELGRDETTPSVNGGAGFDVLAVGAGLQVLSAADFANVTGIEELLLLGSNNVTLTNGLVGSPGSFVVYDGSGAGAVDASGVTNGTRVVFFIGAGDDSMNGGNGSDYFQFNATDLTAADFANGGAGFDVLAIGSGGTVGASAFTNVTGIEELLLSNAGNAVTLTDSLVGSSGSFVVYDGSGDDTVDASQVTSGTRVVFNIGSGNDGFTGSPADDFFALSSGDLAASDTIDGGDGSDFLQITTAGAITSASLAGVSGIEAIGLVSGDVITLVDWLSSAGSLAVYGTDGAETVDGSLIDAYDIVFWGNGGADVLMGGSQNDAFLIPDSSFLEVNGGSAGINDRIVLSAANQSLDVSANAAKISNIDVLWLDLTADNNESVTLTAAAVTAISGAANTLYVVGSADDQVDAGSGWELVTTGVTNSVLAPGYTFNEYLNINGATLFIADQISSTINASADNPPHNEPGWFIA